MLRNSIRDRNKYIIDAFEGNFIFLSSKPLSRFDGFFVKLNNTWYRTISFANKLKEIQCFKEGVYCSTKKSDIFLDCKEIFDDRVWGRNYEVVEDHDCLVVKFYKKNDDNEVRGKEFALFLAFYGDFIFSLLKKWTEHKYSFDKNRNSQPFSRFVYQLGKIDGKFSVGVDLNKSKAIENAKLIFNENDKLTAQKKYKLNSFAANVKAPKKFLKSAFFAAKSLLELYHDNNLMAGIPWFTESWARDELISCKALFLLDRKAYCKNIIFKWLPQLEGLNLKTPLGEMSDSWWIFFRAGEIYDFLNASEHRQLKEALEKNLEKIKTVEGIVLNKKSTWMDSLERDGAIEINALVLAGCKLADKLGINNFRKELEKNVKEKFFDGKFLKDCVHNSAIRPNIFIAYYVYPELLSKKEWELVFDNAIKKLWLSFGGVSTVDKKSKLFHAKHTGELSDSYHNGDSWFWINNLAAIVLHRLNKKKYSKYINKIVKASAKEIVKMGAVEHHAELSDANKLSSKGCLSQAWSNALFVELMFELSSNYF